MKIIIGIIAHEENTEFNFKDNWIKNINLNKNKNIDFYFLYSKTEKDESISIKKKNKYYDFYSHKKEIWSRENSIIMKTLEFYKFITNFYRNQEFYCIRTNLSTLINFKELLKWLNGMPKKNFYGGPMIINTLKGSTLKLISGTFILLTNDIVKKLSLINLELYFFKKIEDDELISYLIFDFLKLVPEIIHVPRLDFVILHEKVIEYLDCSYKEKEMFRKSNIVLFNGCDKSSNIFLYRFKTQNRKDDVILMNLFINLGSLKNIIDFINKNNLIKVINFSKIHIKLINKSKLNEYISYSMN